MGRVRWSAGIDPKDDIRAADVRDSLMERGGSPLHGGRRRTYPPVPVITGRHKEAG